ncbi:MAG TPA: tetratricopeptide repeat protein, partial [Pyrinomonadaceae bacterium]|nr:tetratricopeptide repeat protein [Pyrinomonadaceae bacterium]
IPPVAATDSETRVLRSQDHGRQAKDSADRPPRRQAVVAGIAGMLVVTALGLGSYWLYGRGSSKQIDSIAVMPFVNESGSADLEYLSDGMAESLIKSLSGLPGLIVKPRSSVIRYKGRDADVQTLAHEMNVQAILNGRVAEHGDRLTLSLELVDAQKDAVIWTDRYERARSELVSLQSEIARDVSANLRAKLSGADEQNVSKPTTANSEAYQAYLKGRYFWNKRTYDDLLKAVDHFKSAIEQDDRFGLAYSGLADTYSVLQYYRGSKSNDFVAQARPYAMKAVELDDQSAEAHSSLAFVHEGSWEWADAEREYQRALQLNPNYSSALLRYARFEARVPKSDAEALGRMKRALEAEPSSLVVNDNLSQVYLSQGDVVRALEQAKRTVELDPNYSFGWIDLAYAQLKNGQAADALVSANKVIEVTNRSSRSLVCLGVTNAGAGRPDEARAIVKELETRYAGSQADATDIAAVYAGLASADQAFAWLDKAFADRSSLLVDVRAEYPFAALLNDPRYLELRKRMGMPN